MLEPAANQPEERLSLLANEPDEMRRGQNLISSPCTCLLHTHNNYYPAGCLYYIRIPAS